jgi:hypothetical protein
MTTNQLMLFAEIVAAYHDGHAKRTNALGGKYAEVLLVKTGGTHS